MKDDSGRQWLVSGLAPFEEKTFSFAVEGPGPTEKPRLSSVLLENKGIGGPLAYVVILLLIGAELFAAKKFLERSK